MREKDTVKPNIINKYLEKQEEENIPPTPPTTEGRNTLIDEMTEKIQKQLNIKENAIYEKLKKKEHKPTQVDGLSGVEYERHDNIRFMKALPRHELLYKDSSSIIVAKKCIREYFYRYVLNRKPGLSNKIFLPWGTAYHLFRKVLSEEYGYGDNTPPKHDHEKAKEAFKKAARAGTTYWHKHGEDQKPDSKYDWYTTERLYSSFIKAFEHWTLERKQGKVKVLAIEQYFVVQLSDGRFIQGRIDEIVEVNGELWGRDFKTTSKDESFFERELSPNNQVRTYTFSNKELSNRPVRGLIIQALYNAKSTSKGDKGPSVYEKPIEVTEYELSQWEKEQILWNEFLDLCRTDDVWPQSEGRHCGFCDYHQVCKRPTEASMVHCLETKYVHELWNPAKTDDD